MKRDAARAHPLLGIDEPAFAVEDVLERQLARDEVRDQTMTTARIAIVPRVIAREAEEGVGSGLEFDRAARSPDILVVVAIAGREVAAEAGVAEPGDRRADAQALREGGRDLRDRIELAMRADVGPKHCVGAVSRDASGHIFDRAADRVAAVERALRAAQDLDPFDVVDVEDRGLRTVQIDVVEVQADALLEPGDRILLADAADERRQGAVRTARDFEGDVGSRVCDVRDVEGALPVELLAGISGDRDGNVEEKLVAAAGGYHDRLVARLGGSILQSAGCSLAVGLVSGFSCATAGVVISAAAATVPSNAARAESDAHR